MAVKLFKYMTSFQTRSTHLDLKTKSEDVEDSELIQDSYSEKPDIAFKHRQNNVSETSIQQGTSSRIAEDNSRSPEIKANLPLPNKKLKVDNKSNYFREKSAPSSKIDNVGNAFSKNENANSFSKNRNKKPERPSNMKNGCAHSHTDKIPESNHQGLEFLKLFNKYMYPLYT